MLYHMRNEKSYQAAERDSSKFIGRAGFRPIKRIEQTRDGALLILGIKSKNKMSYGR